MTTSPYPIPLSTTWQILLAAASCGAGVSPAVAAPFPHARTKPDITIEMLQALKEANDGDGSIDAPVGVRRSLVRRSMAKWNDGDDRYYITLLGRTLIRTQYASLLKVLTNDLTAGEPAK